MSCFRYGARGQIAGWRFCRAYMGCPVSDIGSHTLPVLADTPLDFHRKWRLFPKLEGYLGSGQGYLLTPKGWKHIVDNRNKGRLENLTEMHWMVLGPSCCRARSSLPLHRYTSKHFGKRAVEFYKPRFLQLVAQKSEMPIQA